MAKELKDTVDVQEIHTMDVTPPKLGGPLTTCQPAEIYTSHIARPIPE